MSSYEILAAVLTCAADGPGTGVADGTGVAVGVLAGVMVAVTVGVFVTFGAGVADTDGETDTCGVIDGLTDSLTAGSSATTTGEEST